MSLTQFNLATELATKAFTDTVCALDMAKMHETKAFLRNETQYYLAVNCWLNLIANNEGPGVMTEVKGIIRKRGLRDTIALAANTADYVISVLVGRPITPTSEVLGFESLFTNSDVRKVLYSLRFLKRFTLVECSTLMESTYSSFEEIQLRLNWRKRASLKLDSRDPDVWWPRTRFDERVRGYLFRMTYNWRRYYDSLSGTFSNGASSDGATLIAKLNGYRKYSAYLDDPMFPFPWFPGEALPEARMLVDGAPADPLVVKAVPKSYKAYRLIAPESAYNSFNMQKLRKALEMALTNSGYGKYFPINDQTEQRSRAYLGSLGIGFATLDSTAASDSIATYRMKDLLDPDLFDLISKSRPRRYQLGKNGKTVVASTWLTSGHPCTFIIEGMFFLSIACVAREWHAKWTGEWGVMPSVFGDDLIVDLVYFEEVMDLLCRFGITVNASKTFSQGKYRESCGVEYYDGIPMHNVYWPRKSICEHRELSVEDYESLVSLQHRTFDVPSVSRFLTEFVQLQWPAVTSSLPGSEVEDLWSNSPCFSTRLAPYGAYWREGYVKAPLRDDISEVATREVHFTPRNTEQYAPSDSERLLLEAYYYYRFLAEGPIYADPISRLLGVSEPQTRGNALCKPTRKLGLRTIS